MVGLGIRIDNRIKGTEFRTISIHIQSTDHQQISKKPQGNSMGKESL